MSKSKRIKGVLFDMEIRRYKALDEKDRVEVRISDEAPFCSGVSVIALKLHEARKLKEILTQLLDK